MEEKINLIFDCDGTLIDSYDAICERIRKLFLNHHIDYNVQKIKEYCLNSTVRDCIIIISKQHNLDSKQLIDEYRDIKENLDEITLYENVKEILSNNRYNCFCYTHRDKSYQYIFKKLGIFDYFIEVVEASYGLKRKPDKAGIDYLINKYKLDRNNTYYIGDRVIDIECGLNADIKTIFYNSSKINIDASNANYQINDLREINELINRKG